MMPIRTGALLAAELAAGLTGRKRGAGATGFDQDPTGQAFDKSMAGAVVESTNYSRGTNKHTLTCVAPGDRVFEVTVDAHTAYRYIADSSEPCPSTAGPREWWPQDDEEDTR